MVYGYFDEKHKEYVITNPKTPVKWINYVGGLSFGGFVDQTGGSLICKGDPALNRIVKYIPQLPLSDFRGETCYIRINKNNGYELFSPFYTPTLDTYDAYECHVGMGYSTYISVFHGIKTEVKVFVPLDGEVVIRDYKITNITNEPLNIDVIPIVEYTHFDALKQYTNADWVPQTMQSRLFSEDKDHVTLLQYAFMNKDKAINYFTSNYPVSSFETDRSRFLGENGYGSFSHPQCFNHQELSNYLALRGDNIAALMHHLGELKPDETKRIITQLGQTSEPNKLLKRIETYRHVKHVDHAFLRLKANWDEKLKKMVIHTPNQAMNNMINVFNPRQCHTTLNWSRYLSLYQLGLGARGIGVRDSAQDTMGAVIQSPAHTKKLLKMLLHVQRSNGSAMHQFNPLSMVANEGDSLEMEDRYHFYGDDHLWIVLAVTAYLKETGDFKFLEQVIPYYEKDNDEKPIYKDTVLNHLKQALTFTKEHVGKHGLPLLGFADWNDTVNLPKGAESIFNACLYGRALLEMIALMEHLNQDSLVNQYRIDHAHMKDMVNQYAWDGAWFIRYFDDQGKPLGSSKNEHGKIYTNAQSWVVLAGFAGEERAKQALVSLHQYLNTNHGIKLSYPGFNGYDPNKGGVTTYPPGAKENGGIFLHSNPWVMIAETMIGRGDQAFTYYDQINPANKNEHIDEFECEPYVYPQNILGNEHPQFGLGRNSWLSGTASWVYQAATQYMIGVRPNYDGLIVDPCIPKKWKQFQVSRIFRGNHYNIEVLNPNHVEKGVLHIDVDGNRLKTNVIPLFNDNQTHHVVVTMGKSST